MEKNNMKVYDAVCIVPEEAKRPITAGRLSGKTDINPMWRIKALTEQFGVCGFGWKYEVTKQWMETASNGETKAFVNINLYVKMDGEWSDAIFGNGGSSFSENQRNGVYVNDECYKMATTDAISVACKQLGMGADVYWQGDNTKYNDVKREQAQKVVEAQPKTVAVPKKPAGKTPEQKEERIKELGKILNAEPQPAPKTKITTTDLPEGFTAKEFAGVLEKISQCKTKADVTAVHAAYAELKTYAPFRAACNNKFKECAA